MVEVLSFDCLVPFRHPRVSWEHLVLFQQLGVCQGLSTSKRGGEDAAERHLEAGRLSWSKLLQSAASSTKDVRGAATIISLLSLSSYVTVTNFKMETVFLSAGERHVLNWPQGRLFPDNHSSVFSTLSLDCSGGKGLLVPGLCFYFSTACRVLPRELSRQNSLLFCCSIASSSFSSVWTWRLSLIGRSKPLANQWGSASQISRVGMCLRVVAGIVWGSQVFQ